MVVVVVAVLPSCKITLRWPFFLQIIKHKWEGTYNPHLYTLRGWGDIFDTRFVTCHIYGSFNDNER